MKPTEMIESSRKVRKALHAAFPKAKISVKSDTFGIKIEWDDSITDVDGMRTALLKSGVAQAGEPRRDEDVPLLEVDSYRLSLWSFNRAKREADQRDSERRQQEHEAQREREQAALAAAREARKSSFPERLQFERSAPPDPTVYEAFEQLREKAEAQVAAHEGDRRPSWAPPLILGDELAGACRALGYLKADDKSIGRLWATFATPKRSGSYVREHVSTLPLHGIVCRGFQLFAGGERGSTSEILFEAQRREDGTWIFGPSFYPYGYSSPRIRKWEDLIRERERLTGWLQKRSDDRDEARLSTVLSEIATIDAEDAADAERYHERQRLRQSVYRLAQARVLDFVDAPDVQMQAAGRLWGHCCRCGKELTDPLSVERGIGPDCYDGILSWIRGARDKNYSAETASRLIGMPSEFVRTVWEERVVTKPRPQRRPPVGSDDLFGPRTSIPAAAAIAVDDDDWMLPGE